MPHKHEKFIVDSELTDKFKKIAAKEFIFSFLDQYGLSEIIENIEVENTKVYLTLEFGNLHIDTTILEKLRQELFDIYE